jgi:hypothetical protein
MITRLLVILFVFLISENPLYSQNDYIAFYNHCNEGDEHYHLKNYPLALAKYDSAFRKVDFIGVKYLSKYARILQKLDKKKSIEVWRLALLKGIHSNTLKQWDEIFINESRFKEIKDSAIEYNKIYLARINSEYARAIDSLEYVYRCIVMKSCVGFEKDEFKVSVPENRLFLKASIFDCLMKLIGKYGFPSERRIGMSAHKVQYIFYLSMIDPSTEKYLSLLESAVKKGEYDPDSYAYIYDVSRMNKRESLFFYQWSDSIMNLSDEEKLMIDHRRKGYGLKPLRSFDTSETNRIPSSLW